MVGVRWTECDPRHHDHRKDLFPMSEKVAITDIGVVRLLRYGYGGILLCVLGVVINPAKAKQVIEALGPVLSPLAVLAIGAVIYILHRYAVGELFLYRFIHWLHSKWDHWRGRTGTDSTDPVAYLYAIGVKSGQGREAYSIFRRHYYADHDRKQKGENLDIAHSELHMLWLTVDETFAAGIYMSVTDRWEKAMPFLVIGIVVALAAICAEVLQTQPESGLLKAAHNEQELLPFFKKYGILVNDAGGTA